MTSKLPKMANEHSSPTITLQNWGDLLVHMPSWWPCYLLRVKCNCKWLLVPDLHLLDKGHKTSLQHYAPSLTPLKPNRFSGAHQHHYLLDFFQSVANCYQRNGRAGDLVVDLLQLKVPKLFAVVRGEKDEVVRCQFSAFVRDYILRCDLKCTIPGKMSKILVKEPNSCVLCTI